MAKFIQQLPEAVIDQCSQPVFLGVGQTPEIVRDPAEQVQQPVGTEGRQFEVGRAGGRLVRPADGKCEGGFNPGAALSGLAVFKGVEQPGQQLLPDRGRSGNRAAEGSPAREVYPAESEEPAEIPMLVGLRDF